jgi:hypothetical protein
VRGRLSVKKGENEKPSSKTLHQICALIKGRGNSERKKGKRSQFKQK